MGKWISAPPRSLHSGQAVNGRAMVRSPIHGALLCSPVASAQGDPATSALLVVKAKPTKSNRIRKFALQSHTNRAPRYTYTGTLSSADPNLFMQTYTHLVMTAVLNRQLKQATSDTPSTVDALPPIQTGPLLFGSVMPDMPLTILAILLIMVDRMRASNRSDEQKIESLAGKLFRRWFFESRWIKLIHNLFHAPILTVAYVVVGYLGWKMGRRWGPHLFWFGVTCTIHTAIDIPLHHNDGPLLLFPFDWQTRYRSPVSYWDRKHYGGPFIVFEHSLLLGMIVFLGWGWWKGQTSN